MKRAQPKSEEGTCFLALIYILKPLTRNSRKWRPANASDYSIARTMGGAKQKVTLFNVHEIAGAITGV
jgi:hypothetical protein